MTAAPALFERPDPERLVLSKALAAYEHRLAKDEKATWTDIKVKHPGPCMECAHVQHERGGAGNPRRQAKARRKHPLSGDRLELCRGHADLWKERDEKDSGVPSGRKAKR